jgi:hypothetical protein
MNKTQSLKNGVIGLAFLQRFNLLINYPEKQVVLYKQEVVPAINLKSWIRIPFSTKNGFIETDASIDRVKLRLAWDTGFAPSRLKPFNQFKKHIEVCPSNYDIFGKSLVCYTSRQISMSNVKIPNTVFLYTDLNLPNFVPIDGFIGTNFYYKHAVFFDFKNHVMYIRDVHKA